MILALLAGCSDAPAPADIGAFLEGTPLITGLTWGCDVDTAAWSFSITADHWTGGGRLWMARDLAVVEEHRIRSVEAAADGSADTLSLSLSVVADWRDAVAGTSTRWRCDDAAALSFLAVVLPPDGSSRTDCRTWGADPLLWEMTDEITGCETVLEPEDTAEPGER